MVWSWKLLSVFENVRLRSESNLMFMVTHLMKIIQPACQLGAGWKYLGQLLKSRIIQSGNRYLIASCVAILSPFGLNVYALLTPSSSTMVSFEIDDRSILNLTGKTNVNSFDCEWRDRFSKASVLMTCTEGGNVMLFDKASILLRTTSLDCNNEIMNEHLRQTMKSDQYPFIAVSIETVKITGGSLKNIGESAMLKAEALFTITNVRRKVILDVRAHRESENQFRFTSTTLIKMTDYGIEPPTALLGLIKVRDTISLNFDLITRTLGHRPKKWVD